jgi:H+/Cl- antiporter ClcA
MFPQFTVGDSFMIVGASAVLAGYTRQTYSIAVIMLETSQEINLFLPILITIITSTCIGN